MSDSELVNLLKYKLRSNYWHIDSNADILRCVVTMMNMADAAINDLTNRDIEASSFSSTCGEP